MSDQSTTVESAFTSGAPVALETVRQWMREANLNTLGCLFAYLDKPDYGGLIEPALDETERADFYANYLVRCIRENPQDEWASSAYDAGWTLQSYCQILWIRSSKRLSLRLMKLPS